jgi:hypothetical protein
VMILGDVCVLPLIYIHAAVCRFCVVHCIMCFYLLLSNYSTYVFSISFLCFFFVACVCFLFCVFCVLYFLCIDSPLVYSCLFPIFVQVYIPLPPGGNPTAVNKYHVSSYNRLKKIFQ